MKRSAYSRWYELMGEINNRPINPKVETSQNNNMEKQIKMSLETAREWYRLAKKADNYSEGGVNVGVRFLEENFTKEELEGKDGYSWEDSFDNSCFAVIDDGVSRLNCSKVRSNKDKFKTEAQAQSALAFAQLSHIVARYNQDREYFSCCSMITHDLKISITNMFGGKSEEFLGFYEYKDAETSLRVNNELWKQYWMT